MLDLWTRYEIVFPMRITTTVNVLPIVSDPTSEDGDGDTVPDDIDSEPLVPYLIVSKCIYGDYSHDVLKHGLLPAYNNGEYVYECINCGESFIPPELEDITKLSLHEYTLVTALERIYLETLKLDKRYAESIYRIVDRIRSNYSYDYHSEGNLYESPIKYEYTNKNDYDFRINITLNQITHTDLLKNVIAQYEAELLLCGFNVGKIPVGSLIDTYLNWELSNKNFDDKKNLLGNIIGLASDNTKLGAIEDYSSIIGIGNSILTYSYLNKMNTLVNEINSGKIRKYNFYISVDILDKNKGQYIFTGINEFNYLSELSWKDVVSYNLDYPLYNDELTNTYMIINNTEGDIIWNNQRLDIIP